MFKKVVSLAFTVVIFVSALSIPAFADATTPTGSCPLCGSPVQYTNFENLVAGWSIVSCTNPNCAYYQKHMSIANDILYHRDQGVTGGSPSRSNTATVPKNYYTTNNNSSTTNYNTVNSGTTNHYSTINTTNKTLNYTTYNQTTNNYVRNTYNYTNYTYNYDYNYYTVNVDNSTHYVIDNVNYITVLYPTGETVKDESGNDVPEYDYTDIYYQLPDGRNSYDLSASDVWGTYFVYNVTSCEKVAEDDGTTLGLWHLDGDLKDSSYHAGAIVPSFGSMVFKDSVDYSSDLFGKCLYGNSSAYGQAVSFPVSDLQNNTLEVVVYLPDSDEVIFSCSDSASVGSNYSYERYSYIANGNTSRNTFVTKIPLTSGFHSLCFQFNSLTESDFLNGSPFYLYVDGSPMESKFLYFYVQSGHHYNYSNNPFPLSVGFADVKFSGSYFHLGFYNDTQYLDEVRLSQGHLHDSN